MVGVWDPLARVPRTRIQNPLSQFALLSFQVIISFPLLYWRIGSLFSLCNCNVYHSLSLSLCQFKRLQLKVSVVSSLAAATEISHFSLASWRLLMFLFISYWFKKLFLEFFVLLCESVLGFWVFWSQEPICFILFQFGCIPFSVSWFDVLLLLTLILVAIIFSALSIWAFWCFDENNHCWKIPLLGRCGM